jgi:hypothetical protein
MKTSLTLTVEEIKDLAEFTGLRVIGKLDEDEKETEITISKCPKRGVKEDDGSIIHCKHIAHYTEYPEEGVMPLGSPLKPETTKQKQ